VRLGTRGSALALAQARTIAKLLADDTEIVVIESSGAPVDDKSRWTRSLDEALLVGEVDLVLHSAKDVPTDRPSGIVTAAVPAREDCRDAICGASSLESLPSGARIGTASPRREALITNLRDDLHVIELRGNVDTRLRKLADGECDALVIAMAGLNRLGLEENAVPLDPKSFVPAAGQGALLLEGLEDQSQSLEAADAISDGEATARLTAERAVIAQLGADCHTAVGATATIKAGLLSVNAIALAPDGSRSVSATREGTTSEAADLGRFVAEDLIAAGAESLLSQSRGETR
jgi:hydroxymethylbilane synthase